jgi:hypothetical protein
MQAASCARHSSRGAESEMAVRARLDAQLRKRCAPSLRLDTLQRLASSEALPAGARLPRPPRAPGEGAQGEHRRSKSAADWARVFSDALRAMGFPGERTLDSNDTRRSRSGTTSSREFANLERSRP